jgi:ELWxxDGT repeat protein
MAGRRLRAHGTDQCRGHAVLCASDPEHGRELWKSDGTAQRTVLVRDINPGPGHSIPSSPGTRGDVISANLTAVDDTVIFRAFDPAHGLEPWLSDGTAEGTVLVDDINPGSSASIPEAHLGVSPTSPAQCCSRPPTAVLTQRACDVTSSRGRPCPHPIAGP